MSTTSAFKPYKSDSLDCEAMTEAAQTSVDAKSAKVQNQPYDYTVDKILSGATSNSTHSSRLSQSMPVVTMPPFESPKSSSSLIPFDLITQHLLWQRQRQLNPDMLVESPMLGPDNMDTGFYGPHFRRFFAPHPNGPPRQARGPRRQRTTFTHEQTLRLEMEYHVSEYISRSKRFQLAELLDLTENQIKIWFQNRRAKDKRIEKAIVEQQYRYMRVSSSSSLPQQQLNLGSCSTCNYTKHQFESGSNPVTTGSAAPKEPTANVDER